MRAKFFSQNLRAEMKRLGWTRSKLVKETGLTRHTVNNMLNGKRRPSLVTVCALLNVLPVKFEALVTEKR